MAKLKSSTSKKSRSLIAPIEDAAETVSALVYGREGSGKTKFSSTFPRPLLVIDMQERGYRTIQQEENIFLAKVQTWEQVEEVYWEVKDSTRFKSISIDQISTMQAMVMDYVRRRARMKPEDPMSRRVWGEVSGMMQTWLGNFRQLIDQETNVCFIAHERTNDGNDGAEDSQIDPTIGPRVMPSVAGFICGAVDFVGNTFIRERFIGKGKDRERKVDYAMRIGPHTYYRTKVRTPDETEIPDLIVNPSFNQLLALSRGEQLRSKK